MRKICIIGAGISGLTTAKSFLEKGFDVTVYEKGNSLGGVWAKERSYPEVTTQTTRDAYSYSDYPMPPDFPDWPTGDQVLEYLSGYARKFDVMPCIRLNTTVTYLRRRGRHWEAELSSNGSKANELFDFVAICSGTFHKPYIPNYPGTDRFTSKGGKVVHSSQINDSTFFHNKDVITIGFAKSATDISVLASKYGKTSTLIYRKPQWKVPRYFGNKINMKYLLFSRFSEAFFGHHRKSFGEKLLHSIGKPLVWLQWRGLEALLKWQFGLKKAGMVPTHRIEDQISCSLGVEPVGFYDRIHEGKIRAIQSMIRDFTDEGVLLEDGARLKADVVIFGTGFRQNIDFIEKAYRDHLLGDDGSFNLYRNIMHPDVPNLAFIGFNSSLFTTLTSEIASRWVVSYALSDLDLPSRAAMLEEIKREKYWRKHGRPIASEFSGTCVAPFNYHHLDDLMRDMKKRTRASSNFLYESMKPIDPKDYKKILG